MFSPLPLLPPPFLFSKRRTEVGAFPLPSCTGLTVATLLVVVATVARAIGAVVVAVSFAVASIAVSVVAAAIVAAAIVAAVGDERLHLFCPLLTTSFHPLRPSGAWLIFSGPTVSFEVDG